ncbi:hypothetical protein J4E85_003838 [Alternaria conjuncta]|uniref:uncharacterized protein n=1 Tax=Alternaria conjuncta TaxID=181017 RepID=UPI00221FC491|nr:uncharacterized protein J4E85_003838 [Alternaria conjuncta]KAI4931248.1 hypothetical protein J4E85_003838 [Alternaria conjuncta]
MDSIEVYVQAQFAALKARTEDKQQGHAAVSKEPSKASSKSPDPASVHRISFVGDSTSVKVNADQLIDQSKYEQPLIEANFAALERTADPPALAQEHTAGSSATESATAVSVQASQPRMQAGGRPPVAGFHEHVEPAVYQAFLERLGVVNGKNSIAFRTWQAYLNSLTITATVEQLKSEQLESEVKKLKAKLEHTSMSLHEADTDASHLRDEVWELKIELRQAKNKLSDQEKDEYKAIIESAPKRRRVTAYGGDEALRTPATPYQVVSRQVSESPRVPMSPPRLSCSLET